MKDQPTLIGLSHGIKRSSHWPATARHHLCRQPRCLACWEYARPIKQNVHHKYPFHFVVALGRPDLELDERNLFTMCVDHDEEHHLLVGHLGDYESYNPQLETFLPLCRGLLGSQVRSIDAWQEAVHNRPKRLGQMTAKDKKALTSELDRLFPKVKP